MPTYEYQCEKCKETFEIFQSMNDERLTTCPKDKCRQQTWGEGKVKRLLGTGAGIIFKGSGFYQTDYRSSGYREAAKKDSSTVTAGTSESKPAKSSETTSSTASSAPPSTTPSPSKPKSSE